MQAVQDHPRQDRRTPQSGDRRELARKNHVQQLARAATRGIQNRRQRMQARIAVYNELVPLIEQHHRSVQRLHRTYLPIVAGLGLVLTAMILLE